MVEVGELLRMLHLLVQPWLLCLGVGGLEGHLGLGILQRLKWTKWLAEIAHVGHWHSHRNDRSAYLLDLDHLVGIAIHGHVEGRHGEAALLCSLSLSLSLAPLLLVNLPPHITSQHMVRKFDGQ